MFRAQNFVVVDFFHKRRLALNYIQVFKPDLDRDETDIFDIYR